MRDESVYLKHILDAIEKIESYTSGGRETFFQNTMIQDAVIRNLEVIGEAVMRVSYWTEKAKIRFPRLTCR